MEDLTASFDKGNGTALPQNIHSQRDQWPFELPGQDENYVDELTAYATIDEIIEGLPVPSTAPSLATDQPSDFKDLQGQPSTETAKRARNQNSGRISQDVETRNRHRERQRRYRERQRQEEADVKKRFAETATETEKAHLERDILLAEQTALLKIADYCSTAVRAAQNLVSSTIKKAQLQYHNTVDLFAWLGLQVYSPNDSQLQAFVDRKSAEELEAMSAKVLKRTVELFSRYDAEPEARENIEAQLARIQELRFRVFAYLSKTRPEIAVNMAIRRMMPAGPAGMPNPKLEEAIVALELTPEQLESFERQWTLYLQKTASVRQEVRSLISFLSSSGAGENALSFCSVGAAGLFLDRLQAVQDLELHPSEEAQGILSLFHWVTQNLTMHQKARLMRHSMPYYPDVIQMGVIIFGERHGNSIQATRVQSINSELEAC